MLRIKLTPIYITVSLSKGELSRTLGIPRILSNPETSHFGQRESLEFSVSQPKSPQLLLTKFSQASLDQPSARGSSSSKTLCKSDGKSSVTCTYWPWWLKKPTRCRWRKFRGHHWQSSWKVLALLYFPSETVGWPRWAVCALDGDKNCVSSQVQLHLGPPQQQIMSPCQCNMLCVWIFKSFLQSLTVVLGGVYSQNKY